MWLLIVCGLRFRDLLKVKLCKSGSFVKSIKLIENKNKNVAMRYLPQSLIEIAEAG